MESTDRPDDLQATLRRVQKLLAIAQDERADPNEAAAAARQAERIMRKYQIEHAELLSAELKKGAADSFETADVSVVMKRGKGHKPSQVPSWASWICVSVAKLNDCEIRFAWNAEMGACVRFFGYSADVKVAHWMADWLLGETVRGIRQYQREAAWPRTKLESNSFRLGFTQAILGQLRKMRAEKDAEMAAAVTSRALVVVKAQAVAEHFGEFKYRNTKSSARAEANAFTAGVTRGKAVDVGRRAVGSNAAGAGPVARIGG